METDAVIIPKDLLTDLGIDPEKVEVYISAGQLRSLALRAHVNISGRSRAGPLRIRSRLRRKSWKVEDPETGKFLIQEGRDERSAQFGVGLKFQKKFGYVPEEYNITEHSPNGKDKTS